MDQETINRLMSLSAMLERAVFDYRVQDEQAVRAKQVYEVAYARAYLTAVGPVKEREMTALLAVAGEKLDSELKAAVVRATQERIRTLKSQIEVGRSVNAAYRQDYMAGLST